MAIYRPGTTQSSDVKTSNPRDFQGVKQVSLDKFEDKSAKFDWCDILIDFYVKVPISKYPDKGSLIVTFEKDADGKLIQGSQKNGRALKKLYTFLDTLSCKAGVDVYGNWTDENGEKLDSIENYLNDNHLTENDDYYAYIYKEAPKHPGGKSYTKVHHKLYPNRVGNDKKLQQDIDWLKNNGYLKEATAESYSAPKGNDDVDDLPFNGIGNL